jgi:hypothetical protein
LSAYHDPATVRRREEALMSEAARSLDVVVAEDGSVSVAPDRLAELGLRPGDHVKLVTTQRKHRRSMLGVAARPSGFTQDDLRQLRREMGSRLGDDLGR